MKRRWYLGTGIIAICFFFGIFGIPALIGAVLIVLRYLQDKKNLQLCNQINQQTNDLTKKNSELEEKVQNLLKYNEEIGLSTYEEVNKEIERIRTNFEQEKQNLISEIDNFKQTYESEKERLVNEANKQINEEQMQKQSEISSLDAIIDKHTKIESSLSTKISELNDSIQKKEKQLQSQSNKLSRIKELYKSIEYCINNFVEYVPREYEILLNKFDLEEADELAPSVITKLHSMDIKSLKKSFKENDKQITSILEQYSSRYTTKANQAIYSLMVIALRAELQNILSNLKYEKLDTAIEQVKLTTSKYLKIAGEGNQTIVGTLTKFISQIEYFFINAVKIEYNYYVKKEQAKQEQLALREQMRQEAEERKALEAERKKIEKEEEKYHTEIDKLNEQMTSASDDELEKLKSRILELQSQLSNVIVKKEEISNLANGKAGNVYIISNLGSFGENVFKIGMTRRLDPQDRINELSSASVPFKFDVHSFIFSDDAVSLENKLHTMLNNKRVNKVNLRKEFFYTTIDELEKLVNDIEPTAEFNRTMVAEEFHQSQSSDKVYSTINEYIDDDSNE